MTAIAETLNLEQSHKGRRTASASALGKFTNKNKRKMFKIGRKFYLLLGFWKLEREEMNIQNEL